MQDARLEAQRCNSCFPYLLCLDVSHHVINVSISCFGVGWIIIIKLGFNLFALEMRNPSPHSIFIALMNWFGYCYASPSFSFDVPILNLWLRSHLLFGNIVAIFCLYGKFMTLITSEAWFCLISSTSIGNWLPVFSSYGIFIACAH